MAGQESDAQLDADSRMDVIEESDSVPSFFIIRDSRSTREILKEIFVGQSVTGDKSFIDVHLLCRDGYVPVHGCLLATVSKWFQEIFETLLSENCNCKNEIFHVSLPDFDKEEISSLVNIIYRGVTLIENEQQGERLIETIKYFRIKMPKLKIRKFNPADPTPLKIQTFNFDTLQIHDNISECSSSNTQKYILTATNTNTNSIDIDIDAEMTELHAPDDVSARDLEVTLSLFDNQENQNVFNENPPIFNINNEKQQVESNAIKEGQEAVDTSQDLITSTSTNTIPDLSSAQVEEQTEKIPIAITEEEMVNNPGLLSQLDDMLMGTDLDLALSFPYNDNATNLSNDISTTNTSISQQQTEPSSSNNDAPPATVTSNTNTSISNNDIEIMLESESSNVEPSSSPTKNEKTEEQTTSICTSSASTPSKSQAFTAAADKTSPLDCNSDDDDDKDKTKHESPSKSRKDGKKCNKNKTASKNKNSDTSVSDVEMEKASDSSSEKDKDKDTLDEEKASDSSSEKDKDQDDSESDAYADFVDADPTVEVSSDSNTNSGNTTSSSENDKTESDQDFATATAASSAPINGKRKRRIKTRSSKNHESDEESDSRETGGRRLRKRRIVKKYDESPSNSDDDENLRKKLKSNTNKKTNESKDDTFSSTSSDSEFALSENVASLSSLSSTSSSSSGNESMDDDDVILLTTPKPNSNPVGDSAISTQVITISDSDSETAGTEEMSLPQPTQSKEEPKVKPKEESKVKPKEESKVKPKEEEGPKVKPKDVSRVKPGLSRKERLAELVIKAKTCQYCNTKYDTPSGASGCLAKHGKLRCYFCYKTVKNTEKLFHHFESKHHSPNIAKESVICVFCKQTIPNKSVSCHVISIHLNTDDKTKTSAATTTAAATNQNNVVTPSTSTNNSEIIDASIPSSSAAVAGSSICSKQPDDKVKESKDKKEKKKKRGRKPKVVVEAEKAAEKEEETSSLLTGQRKYSIEDGQVAQIEIPSSSTNSSKRSQRLSLKYSTNSILPETTRSFVLKTRDI